MANITEEELRQLQQIKQNFNVVVEELGRIEFQKITLEERSSAARQYLADYREAEKEALASLTEKYGDISINLETGEITEAEK